jgi:hypothetical protein
MQVFGLARSHDDLEMPEENNANTRNSSYPDLYLTMFSTRGSLKLLLA